jgi:UDP-N-acetylglucosamine--N-acetylmuramyl-(pentapeptide) pyrophosphoryl-undecaprenol N-acetylglucosamine transferase
VGKPVIYIPSPNVAEDHQTKNAKSLADKQAAILIKESNLETEFETVFTDLFKDKNQQKELGDNSKKLAMPNATVAIVDEIEKLLFK